MKNKDLKVAVIIPCKNQDHIIKLTIDNLLYNQSTVPNCIFVIDDGSDSCSIKSNKDVMVINTNGYVGPSNKYITGSDSKGRANTRNLGIWATAWYGCNPDVIIFMDGDTYPAHNDFIKNYVEEFQDNPNRMIFGLRQHVFEINHNGTILKSGPLEKYPSDLLTANMGNDKEKDFIDLRKMSGTMERFNVAKGTEIDDYILSGWIAWSCCFATTPLVLDNIFKLNEKIYDKGCYFASEMFGPQWGCEDSAFGMDAKFAGADIKIIDKTLIYHLMHDASNNYDTASNDRRRHILFERYRTLLCEDRCRTSLYKD